MSPSRPSAAEPGSPRTVLARVYLGLGSNIQPERYLAEAVLRLGETTGLTSLAISPVYRTPPWGDTRQPEFLNAVLAADTTLEPLALLDCLLALERVLDRVRTHRWGPRTIDLDLLLYGERIVCEERLTVPHPWMHERAFVLVPLCDLAPDLRHPVLGHTMRELRDALPAEGIVRVPLRLALHRAPPD